MVIQIKPCRQHTEPSGNLRLGFVVSVPILSGRLGPGLGPMLILGLGGGVILGDGVTLGVGVILGNGCVLGTDIPEGDIEGGDFGLG